MSSESEHAFTAPITVVNSAAFPLPRKRLDVWPALTIALLAVGLICAGSYALALRVELDHVQAKNRVLQNQVSTLNQEIHQLSH